MAKAQLKATMKGFRNSKADMTADYIADMKAAKENKELQDQKSEFVPYLTSKLERRENDFFRSMLSKIQQNVILTENMVTALRRCMTTDAEQKDKAAQPVDENKLPKATFKMKQWWMKANKMDSRVVSGVILKETAKAYLMKGHADIIDGCWCMRCGRELTEPASMAIMFGEVCAAKVGVPYPVGILTAPKKERTKIRKQLEKVLHGQTFEAWVPKSQIEDVIEMSKPSK